MHPPRAAVNNSAQAFRLMTRSPFRLSPVVACRYTSARASSELSLKSEKFAMSKWIFVCEPCLTCLSILAAGALPRQGSEIAPPADDAFVAHSLPLDVAAGGSKIDGASVFEQARANLRDARWLRVTIWQRSHDDEHPYESTAKLLLGPDHCARMETTLHAGAGSCQHLLVSDGRAVAEVDRFAGAAEKVS